MRNLNINNTYNNMHSMHNYHNIIPIILIDVIIILVFEGLVFFLYLAKEQEKIVTHEVSGALNINRNPEEPILEQIVDTIIKQSMDNEKNYINKEYTNGVIYYICMVVGILIFLCIYVYYVYKKLYKHIDWISILCIVFITFVLIMLLEGLFIKFVLFNKQFNGKQLKLDFYNAIIHNT